MSDDETPTRPFVGPLMKRALQMYVDGRGVRAIKNETGIEQTTLYGIIRDLTPAQIDQIISRDED